jgi:hypothetical protein
VKIKNSGNTAATKINTGTGSGADKISSPAAGAPSFADSVKAAQRGKVDGELQSLIDDVQRQGERFLKSPSEDRLEGYKNSVQAFLKRAGKELFSLKEECGTAGQGRQKVYQLVETVNHELEALTRDTLQGDKALQLLAGLDDIRGLVVDLIT